MVGFSQILGFIGTILIAVAYVPQIIHLMKTRCTMGVDKGAWFLWVIASILLLIHAISTKEPVFITLVSVNLLSTVVIFSLKLTFADNMCKDHMVKPKRKHK